jgi:hypothetical protein
MYRLHVVCLAVPLPANYGGAIDMFYKLQELKKNGVQIQLHCFLYGNATPQPALEELAENVYYYSRSISYRIDLPYIVSSRLSMELLENLCRDQDPILFEGVHTIGWANHERLQHRVKFLRAHNIEHRYYQNLKRNTNHLFKKSYFFMESFLLKQYENRLPAFDAIFCISEKETIFFQDFSKAAVWLPAFHGNSTITATTGKGKFCLYHGNLSVPENESIALYLMDKFETQHTHQLVVAGKNPSERIKRKASSVCRVIENPGEGEMKQLLQDAHIHLLFSKQPSGVKLKLIDSLFQGRFCLVDRATLSGSGLKGGYVLVEIRQVMNKVYEYMLKDFSEQDIQERKEVLLPLQRENNVKIILQELEKARRKESKS